MNINKIRPYLNASIFLLAALVAFARNILDIPREGCSEGETSIIFWVCIGFSNLYWPKDGEEE